MKLNKKVILILLVVVVLLISSLLFWYQSQSKISSFELKDESEKILDAKKSGDDVVGWLRVEGTNIDLPLIARNNVADISVREDYQFAWTNSFPDEKSNHLTFISHNIRNVSSNPIVNDNSMTYFEQLMSFIYEDFVNKNQFIELTDVTSESSIYKIYGVALIDENQSMSYYDTYTKKELSEYIEKAQKESMYDIDVDVNEDDKLLTLYTCTRFYGLGDTYSFRVDARKLREGENMKYSKVEVNDNYKKIAKKMKEGEKNEKI